ncbi:hypothetical protein OSB04_un000943 [Centaurea solstitialis]|uniref:Uncharacterized protein n=1 Tax=Centaurea solstitialis TaxID=347529 RepID=A0AA38SMN4_9ASTR|nr:hypothetical protein OSB04_un000943 [Centaurea solstitialis]
MILLLGDSPVIMVFLRGLVGESLGILFGSYNPLRDFHGVLWVTSMISCVPPIRWGRSPYPQSLLDGFQSAIDDCSLIEIDLTGGTLRGKRVEVPLTGLMKDLIECLRLHPGDKNSLFVSSRYFMLVYLIMTPYFLICSVLLSQRKSSASFQSEVTNHWKSIASGHLLSRLISVSSFMSKWGRNFFHKFRDKIKKTKGSVAKSLLETTSKDVLAHRGGYELQILPCFSLHSKKVNHISCLVDDSGNVVEDHEGMCTIVKSYFENIFASTHSIASVNNDITEPVVTEADNERLTAEVTFEEFTAAIKQMHPNKASGPDGLNPAFF